MNERLAVDNVIRNLNSFSSPLVSSFCYIPWLQYGNKLKTLLDGGICLVISLAGNA